MNETSNRTLGKACSPGRRLLLAVLISVVTLRCESPVGAQESAAEPVATTAAYREKLRVTLQTTIDAATAKIDGKKGEYAAHSERGDAYFFRGEFAASVADYDRMVILKPDSEASHWRRGIALFYAQKYEAAAKQFDLYHSFDDVDRENGIWRYLCQRRAFGEKKAGEGLLKYKKDDRPPLPQVYRMFAGELTPEKLLEEVAKQAQGENERASYLFYAELYVGLYLDVCGKPEAALPHLEKATQSAWPRKAGYGPNYMWHVARVHHALLSAPKKEASQ